MMTETTYNPSSLQTSNISLIFLNTGVKSLLDTPCCLKSKTHAINSSFKAYISILSSIESLVARLCISLVTTMHILMARSFCMYKLSTFTFLEDVILYRDILQIAYKLLTSCLNVCCLLLDLKIQLCFKLFIFYNKPLFLQVIFIKNQVVIISIHKSGLIHCNELPVTILDMLPIQRYFNHCFPKIHYIIDRFI
jgi:hypothetical protein